jgi:tetratricopeptide (TPR) repeat protein
MRVLVALVEARGAVLSRDDLIELCWDGTIVGDNAINRVISLLRQVLARLTAGAVRLETITKVGFRLIADAGSSLAVPESQFVQADEESGTAALTRRRLILGGACAALTVAIGSGVYVTSANSAIDPRALRLAREADRLMKSGLPGSTRQATRNLERAVEIAPSFAEGWGNLALMYRHALHGFASGERANFVRMVDSAAERALALKADQPDARLALALKRPFLGRWLGAEEDIRSVLADYPDHWYANAQLSLLLMDVGRAEAALPFRERVIAVDPMIPVVWAYLALNKLMANQLHEADAVLDRAFSTWPNHAALWFARYRVLIESDRPLEAAAFARMPKLQPDNFAEEDFEFASSCAQAIAQTAGYSRAEAVARILTTSQGPEAAESNAPLLALLGQPDHALALATSSLVGGRFGGKEWSAPDAFTMRPTAYLFYPSFLALAARPAYVELLRRSGLEEYWELSGSQPDFRRG